MNILHTSCAEQVSLPKMHRAVVKIKHGLNDICCGVVALLSNAIFFTQICNSHYFFCVEILVCMRHLKAGTRGPTDALVLPHLQLTWLLITLQLQLGKLFLCFGKPTKCHLSLHGYQN